MISLLSMRAVPWPVLPPCWGAPPAGAAPPGALCAACAPSFCGICIARALPCDTFSAASAVGAAPVCGCDCGPQLLDTSVRGSCAEGGGKLVAMGGGGKGETPCAICWGWNSMRPPANCCCCCCCCCCCPKPRAWPGTPAAGPCAPPGIPARSLYAIVLIDWAFCAIVEQIVVCAVPGAAARWLLSSKPRDARAEQALAFALPPRLFCADMRAPASRWPLQEYVRLRCPSLARSRALQHLPHTLVLRGGCAEAWRQGAG